MEPSFLEQLVPCCRGVRLAFEGAVGAHQTAAPWISGEPDEDRVGTSRIERFNWTLRTGLRRFVRLSNGFSRKRANLAAAVAIFVAYYNFVKLQRASG